jgi:hypothetical protein
MKHLQAYKFELMPTGDQQRDMRRFAGSCRFVFNLALAMQKECPLRFPAQDHDHDQPKPRDRVHRGLAGTEHVPISGRQPRSSGA